MPIDERLAWEAVLERDASVSASFVYGVRTTGVYCRTTCASRRPRRENVAFFRTPEDAKRAGLRACKRCRPDGADPLGDAVTGACEILERGPVTLERLGRAVGVAPTHLQRVFRERTGVTPREYSEALRVLRLKASLREETDVARSAFDAGYGSLSSAYAAADAHLGMTPASYAAGGRGAQIGFAIVDCPLGLLLVARTGRGVCAVALGARAGELEEALREEFPQAQIAADDGVRAQALAVAALATGAPSPVDIPLDVRATAFQWRVWRALREIPSGTTSSYSEVAAAIGEPTAARAVARACATNPVALVIPCHRVVRADGSPAGYRWGAERKQRLLALEAGVKS